MLDLIAATDEALANQLAAEINLSVTLARAIPNPFDDHLREGVPDSAYGRQRVLDAIEALEDQTDTIVSAAQKVGITISVS